jgi:formamidopyrimidine-DNA glycosylase
VEDDIVMENITHTDLIAQLTSRRVLDTGRHGKWFWMTLDNNTVLCMHLGMTGVVYRDDDMTDVYRATKRLDKGDVWPPRFTKVWWTLDSGSRVAFADARRLGRLRLIALTPDKNVIGMHPPISDLAPDAHTAMPTSELFAACLKLTRNGQANTRQIKALLLDQNATLSGIGNWIADEVLFHAGIHPMTPCFVLSDAEAKRLHDAVVHVIGFAVNVNADSNQFPREWLFHYRWDKPRAGSKSTTLPRMPDGRIIRFVNAGGRTSAFIEGHQVMRSTPHKSASDQIREATADSIAVSDNVVQKHTPAKKPKKRSIVDKASTATSLPSQAVPQRRYTLRNRTK